MKKSTYLYFIGLVAMVGVIFAQQTSTTTFVNPLPKDKFVFLEIVEVNYDKILRGKGCVECIQGFMMKVPPSLYMFNKQTKELIFLRGTRKLEEFTNVVLFIDYNLHFHGKERRGGLEGLTPVKELPFSFSLIFKTFHHDKSNIIQPKGISYEKLIIDSINKEGVVKLFLNSDEVVLKDGDSFTKKGKKIVKCKKCRSKVEFVTELRITNLGLGEKIVVEEKQKK